MLAVVCATDGKIDKEIDNRLAKAYRAFGKLHKTVWCNKHLKKSTKISAYRAIVLSTLLYGSESWVIYCHHLQLLERFHQSCLRSILNIHWCDYVTSVSVLEQAGVSSIEAMLIRTQLCWAGHVSRMEDRCLLKIVLYGELATGCHKRRALKKRYKDSLKNTSALAILAATSRDSWICAIHDAAASFVNACRLNATLTLDPVKSQKLRRVGSGSDLLGIPGAVGSSPEDFTVTIQAQLYMADEP
ncbi:hypothetical protein WISP_75833 [Willisornis vidua]|uniref:Uncharacterized protein n=1 Tax=Willisornis vidua TaxID=1566151 RepID=A0ABQ9D931_9PASS|nr:hypothetical protein WISP_75833 [Willisornis vidua]